MKTQKLILTGLISLLINCPLLSQVPQGFKYQSVCRDAAGNLIQNQDISVRLSLHDLDPLGTLIYQETFDVTTNQFSIINLNVGSGIVQSGVFADIAWESGSKFLEIEIDTGTGYLSVGTSQLLSVPYALHAGTSEKLTEPNAWSLLGNTGTDEVNNFIGTSDNTSLNFRVFNQSAGKIHPAGQVFMGYQAGKNNLMDHATAFGYQALTSNTTGDVNSAFGYYALRNNITGAANTAIGNEAMRNNTTGDWSTALGVAALVNNTIGTHNTALGAVSLSSNTIGTSNTAGGYGSILENISGIGNTGFGMYALKSNTNGMFNTALGLESGYNNSSGSYNVFLGYRAGYEETGSNKLYIANSSANPPLIYGDFSTGMVGIGTTNTLKKLTVAGNMEIQADGAWIPGASARLYLGPDDNVWIEHINYGGLNVEVAMGWPLYIRNGGCVTMSIDGSGNVGIGTLSPGANLDVNGQIKITGGSPGSGKVLTSDAAGLASWEAPVSAGSHYIGEVYGGGIVFYVYDNGQHGLIASTADISSAVQWYNGTDRYTGSTGDGLLAGAMNTTLIIATQISDNQTGSFAARLCADYSVTVDNITYGDWYLPSLYELSLLYLQKDIVGGFGTGRYWSSMEADNSPVNAWWINMGFGYTGGVAKSQANSVRPIRAF